MLSPEEIVAILQLKKISQTQLAEMCSVPKSQLSTIIWKTHEILPRLTEVLGENPFALSEAEWNEVSRYFSEASAN